MNKGVLLINLGSPKSSEVADVRVYLREFLMDKRVIDVPWMLRKFIVEVGILPQRPKRSAKAYKKIWREDGSPLVVISQQLACKLQQKSEFPVALAMRYQSPSIKEGIQKLIDKGASDILVIPLYPQYAMSSTQTVIEKTKEVQRKFFKNTGIKFLPPFYNDKEYLRILAASIQKKLPKDFDLLLFSYHGIPERHILKSDPYGHCSLGSCCFESKLDSHRFCYRHQCYYTTEQIRLLLGLEKSKVYQSFQSRLGKNPWLKPHTDKTLAELPSQGIKKIVVVSPAFVADCLETLEEISIQGKDTFFSNGGTQFTYINCLNDSDAWVDFLKQQADKFEGVLEL